MTIAKILAALLLIPSLCFAGIDFDGAAASGDDGLACGSTDDILMDSTALTIHAWIKPDSTGEGGFGRIIQRDSGAGNVFLIMTATATVRFGAAGSTSLVREAANNSLTLGVWNHVLVTWDGSTTAANSHIYVNGTEVSYKTTTNGSGFTDNASGTLRIGQSNAGDRTFDGIIGEVALWNAEVSAQDILNLANSKGKGMPLQILKANQKGYWPLDDEEDGSSADGDTFQNRMVIGSHTCTGDDGAGNTGLTAKAEEVLTYP